MSRKFDVVATVGTYKKGEETKYLNKTVGSIIETKHGLRLKLGAWFNPAGCARDEDGSIWLALFEPKDKPQGQQQSQDNGGFKDDDIVF